MEFNADAKWAELSIKHLLREVTDLIKRVSELEKNSGPQPGHNED